MPKRYGNCWLYRDNKDNNGVNRYRISKKRPTWINGWRIEGASIEFVPLLFHKLSSVRLKPGEGPMRAQISIEF